MKVMRAVVGHEERPYDRDIAGKPITRRWDVLACGHVLPSHFVMGIRKVIADSNGGDQYQNHTERNCKKCEAATT